MITAQELFRDHVAHQVLARLLTESIKAVEEWQVQCMVDLDGEIEALSLARGPLDNMPHSARRISPTERVAEQVRDIVVGREKTTKEEQLRLVQWYLQLYDTIMELLTDKEKWFVDRFYNHNNTFSQMIELENGPFYGYDRSTIWRFKKRLLKKADDMLNTAFAQKG